MPYTLKVAESLEREIHKLRKKDRETHKEMFRKIERILSDPYHFGQPLRLDMKDFGRLKSKITFLYTR